MHGAGARVTRARIVERDDDVREVGDEALIAARTLAAKVVVAPTRAEAIAFAARHAATIVVDRLLQARPLRLARSLLAVDASAPFGSGATLPFGDLVAPRERLLAACDELVAIEPSAELLSLDPRARTMRVGAVASLARPGRMLRALRALGVEPAVFVERADHAPVSERERRALDRLSSRAGLDGWIVDAKTAVLGWPGMELQHRVILPAGVVDRAVAEAC
jgi:tetraacyldisaccharide-1-P 4'-kinase